MAYDSHRIGHRCKHQFTFSRLPGEAKTKDHVNADKFRSIALSIPGAVESSHQGHPDFRLGGKVFASLGYPDEDHGMVKLTSEQQELFLKRGAGVFAPCAGMWGKRGATSVHLHSAKVGLVREALESAAKNVAEKKKD